MDRIVRIEEAATTLGVSPRTVYRLERQAPDFPQRVRVSERRSGFSEQALSEFIKRRAGGTEVTGGAAA